MKPTEQELAELAVTEWIDVPVSEIKPGDLVTVRGYAVQSAAVTHVPSVINQEVEVLREYAAGIEFQWGALTYCIHKQNILSARRIRKAKREEKVEEQVLSCHYVISPAVVCKKAYGHTWPHDSNPKDPTPAQPPKPAPGDWNVRTNTLIPVEDWRVYRSPGVWSSDTRKAGERRITWWRECDWPEPGKEEVGK